MKKVMVGFFLVGILSSCTYNTYTVKQDDQPKDKVKRAELKENNNSLKDTRDQLIKTCRTAEDSPCIFTQRNGIDHFVLVYPNKKEMLTSKEATMDIAAAFCLSSAELSIPAQFHVALLYEMVAQDLNCSTDTWGEWYSFNLKAQE
jgi:hypothetical protein